MALSASGKTALIGAYVDDCAADPFCGAAYVFVREGSRWVERQKFTASAINSNYFGSPVALSASGKTALIGDCNAGFGCGAAYVFVR